MQNFRDLIVWQRSRALAKAIYRCTESFPKSELYGLTSQVRRAAVSIVANIAEGCGRDSQAELKRFLYIAQGSAAELEALLLVSADLGYLQSDAHEQLEGELTEIRRMLSGLLARVETTKN